MRNPWLALLAAAVLVGWSGAAAPQAWGENSAPPGAAATSDKKLTDEQIKTLIEKLGADDFKTRTAAHKELAAARAAALPALEKASHSSDAEVSAQAQEVINEIHRALSAAASEALAKQQLWCYPMENGAAWTNGCNWPVICGNTGYVAGMDGKLHAVDLQTGKPRWTADLDTKGFGNFQVAAGEKYVTALQMSSLTVYDTKEGKQLWQKEIKPAQGNGGGLGLQAVPGGPAVAPGGAAGGGPVAQPMFRIAGPIMMLSRAEAWVVGDLVVVRNGDKINAYKGSGGEDAWQMDVKPPTASCNSIVENGIAYLAEGQSVAAVDLAGQKELWSQEMPGCVKLARGGAALVCAAGTKIVALDSKTGRKLWDAQIASDGAAGPAAMKGAVPGGAAPPGAFNGGLVVHGGMLPAGGMLAQKITVDDTRVYVVAGQTLTTFDLKTGGKSGTALDLGDENAADAGGPAADAKMMVRPQVPINQVVAAEGTLYGVTNGGILAFDGQNGGRLWTLPLNQVLPTEPVVTGGVLYFVNSGARFRAKNVRMMRPVDAGAPEAADAAAPAAESPLNQPGLHALKVAR